MAKVFATVDHLKWGRITVGEGNGTSLQYSCLETPMDREAWWAAVHGVAKSWTRLSDFTFTFHFHALEKEMATHSSVLAWRIPGTGESDGLPSMGSHRVRHDWSELAAAAAAPKKALRATMDQKYLWVQRETQRGLGICWLAASHSLSSVLSNSTNHSLSLSSPHFQ